jgi:hypothetical protein
MNGSADSFARGSSSYNPIFESRAEGYRTTSKNRASFWTSLRRLRKRKTFTFVIFLVRRFHEPVQFSSRFSILFHLAIPIVLFDRIEQRGQFAALFWRELVDSRFDLFDTTHVPNLCAHEEPTRVLCPFCSRLKNVRKRALFERSEMICRAPVLGAIA